VTTTTSHRLSRVCIGENRRFLVTQSGEPFFWLGDTAWLMLPRLSREDIDSYLRIRAAQRFTVIHLAAVVAGSASGGESNSYGHAPLTDGRLDRPVDDYFDHLDYVIARAAAHGIYVAILPWLARPGAAEVVGAGGEAALLAGYLARRYRDQPVLWMLAHDQGDERALAEARAMAAVLREQGGGGQLIARLPGAVVPGGEVAPPRPWHDLELQGSGQGSASVWIGGGDWQQALNGKRQLPAGAALDGQPGALATLASNAAEVRRVGYWEVFAGACGFCFVDQLMWSFDDGGGKAGTPGWREELFHVAAEDMQFLRQLVESRPYLCRIPDQGVLVGDVLSGPDHLRATRGADGPQGATGSYAFAFSAGGKPVTADLTKLTGSMIMASWFDPRSGVSTWLGQFAVRGKRAFQPPSAEDWVLVLEDSARHYQQLGFGSDRRSTS
jgi:hypothetical protein